MQIDQCYIILVPKKRQLLDTQSERLLKYKLIIEHPFIISNCLPIPIEIEFVHSDDINHKSIFNKHRKKISFINPFNEGLHDNFNEKINLKELQIAKNNFIKLDPQESIYLSEYS